MVTQLLSCMDVIVIGALDQALRRRFVKEMYVGMPDDKAREEILSLLTRDLPLESTCDSARLARLTPGYVGSAFEAFFMEAGIAAANKITDSRKSQLCIDTDSAMRLSLSENEEKKRLFYSTSDFEVALKKVHIGSRPIEQICWRHQEGY